MDPIITIPAATTTLSAVAGWSGPLFEFLLPVALIVAGLLIGGAIVGYFVGAIRGGAARVVGSGKKSRRRRR